MPSSPPPSLTPTQLSLYLTHLFPTSPSTPHPTPPLSSHPPSTQHTYLTTLLTHHLATIPFENLSLHYSPHRQISLHRDALFQKIVGDGKGRGGYCMENNALFGLLLKGLGFVVYEAGARVWNPSAEGEGEGSSHMINIVTIGTKKYHVDVGFGSQGPIVPMPLDTSSPIQPHLTPASARLQYKNIPGTTDPSQRYWVYEHRASPNTSFQPRYCFTELEFLPSDYQVMNYFTSTSNKTWFTRTVVVERKVMGEGGELVGDVTVNGDVMKRRGKDGVKEREVKFASEEERVRALEEEFGIRLDEVERDGIKGLPSEIK
ncbi:arylamine N-acetyltransferase 1 [Periconia macrospinosa]|uniref:Arylamine N-acetyltransferase 1 n=1 Tax=Periconia macrospinosa TaxID=97972 RepID=A0A2V1DQG1_9PLEO|nr:arylamine N-acetyltransferase 1 [Periconia macrospinosa]